MSGPLSWWANRKSRMGLKPSAKKPPHAPGKEWWTDPPTSVPMPEHMEYAAQFMTQLLAQPPSDKRNAMQSYIGKWMRSAQALLSRGMFSIEIEDSHTTDGALLAAHSAIHELVGELRKRGGEPSKRVMDVKLLLDDRTRTIRRERATERTSRGEKFETKRSQP